MILVRKYFQQRLVTGTVFWPKKVNIVEFPTLHLLHSGSKVKGHSNQFSKHPKLCVYIVRTDSTVQTKNGVINEIRHGKPLIAKMFFYFLFAPLNNVIFDYLCDTIMKCGFTFLSFQHFQQRFGTTGKYTRFYPRLIQYARIKKYFILKMCFKVWVM